MDFEFARAIVRAERLEGHDAWQMWSQTTRKDHYANIDTSCNSKVTPYQTSQATRKGSGPGATAGRDGRDGMIGSRSP